MSFPATMVMIIITWAYARCTKNEPKERKKLATANTMTTSSSAMRTYLTPQWFQQRCELLQKFSGKKEVDAEEKSHSISFVPSLARFSFARETKNNFYAVSIFFIVVLSALLFSFTLRWSERASSALDFKTRRKLEKKKKVEKKL